MFKLQLAGFAPLQDFEIMSPNNIFIVSGDDGMGPDFFTKILYYICRMCTETKIGSLYELFEIYENFPERLAFMMTLDKLQYQVILEKKGVDYTVEHEALLDGKTYNFVHKGNTCNVRNSAPEDSLYWKVLRYTSGDIPFLEHFRARDMSEFLWYNDFSLSHRAMHERMKNLFFDYGTCYIDQIDDYLHRLTDDYSGLTKVVSSVTGKDLFSVYDEAAKENTWFHSWKLTGILSMLHSLLNGVKVLWHPESVINNQKIANLFTILKDFTIDKPIFIVTDNQKYADFGTRLYFENCGKEIRCKKLQ